MAFENVLQKVCKALFFAKGLQSLIHNPDFITFLKFSHEPAL